MPLPSLGSVTSYCSLRWPLLPLPEALLELRLPTFIFIADQTTINGYNCLIPSNPAQFQTRVPFLCLLESLDSNALAVSWNGPSTSSRNSSNSCLFLLSITPLILSLTITSSGWNSSINRIHLLKALPWLLFVLYCIL